MASHRLMPSLCDACHWRLFQTLAAGAWAGPPLGLFVPRIRPWRKFVSRHPARRSLESRAKSHSTARPFGDSSRGSPEVGALEEDSFESRAEEARIRHGETLPEGYLTGPELQVYERMYGPPVRFTPKLEDDVVETRTSPEGSVEQEGNNDVSPNVLMRQNDDGNLEEIPIDYEDDNGSALERDLLDEDDEVDQEVSMSNEALLAQVVRANRRQRRLLGHMQYNKNAGGRNIDQSEQVESDVTPHEPSEQIELQEEEVADELEVASHVELELDDDLGHDRINSGEVTKSGGSASQHARTHALTRLCRSGTSPSTVGMPQRFAQTSQMMLANSSNKHLREAAEKALGGPGLPFSASVVRRQNMRQQPIGLNTAQSKMKDMEANAFVATVMPNTYASCLHTLVEVRKRIGRDWLPRLIRKGPRILDAGSGGAAIIAWREMLQATWKLMYPDGHPKNESVPLGRSTVVTGAESLRRKASQLLDETVFIPRLPDYDVTQDHPSVEGKNPQARKKYDVIIAPHTLWSLGEDHRRKAQVQNLWSLLDPQGGVLILLEKAVPRGFELIAEARETLLKYHIPSTLPAEEVKDSPTNKYGGKQTGMILAPCTSHGKCPMYLTPGPQSHRKDICHFSQRFIRPRYHQTILGFRDQNHEDAKFSYVAFQRGVDHREQGTLVQGDQATRAAFDGYEHEHEREKQHQHKNPSKNNQSRYDRSIEHTPDVSQHDSPSTFSPTTMHPLSLPRIILPPIKRQGHVTLDLCTPSGHIERWTVPKSFSKQSYRDARKSHWGDLWALGAKTRVNRSIRLGRPQLLESSSPSSPSSMNNKNKKRKDKDMVKEKDESQRDELTRHQLEEISAKTGGLEISPAEIRRALDKKSNQSKEKDLTQTQRKGLTVEELDGRFIEDFTSLRSVEEEKYSKQKAKRERRGLKHKSQLYGR